MSESLKSVGKFLLKLSLLKFPAKPDLNLANFWHLFFICSKTKGTQILALKYSTENALDFQEPGKKYKYREIQRLFG